LFEFSSLANGAGAGNGGALPCRRQGQRVQGVCVSFREMFDAAAPRHPEVKADRTLFDACSALLVKLPWDSTDGDGEHGRRLLSDMTAPYPAA